MLAAASSEDFEQPQRELWSSLSGFCRALAAQSLFEVCIWAQRAFCRALAARVSFFVCAFGRRVYLPCFGGIFFVCFWAQSVFAVLWRRWQTQHLRSALQRASRCRSSPAARSSRSRSPFRYLDANAARAAETSRDQPKSTQNKTNTARPAETRPEPHRTHKRSENS